MPTPAFSPFSEALDRISIDDLAALRDPSEGWYVEYKSELTSQKAIAKAISAFANTYGGWIFYGISEDSGGQRIAGEYCGIPVSDAPAAETRIRQAVSAHMNPPAFFRSRVLIGPSSELDLPKDRAIIAIEVALSLDAPHVHSDGRIYRRVADESDPRPETDRHFLDLLWTRRRDARKSVEDRLREEPSLSKAEENDTYFDIFITPDVYGEFGASDTLNFDEFVELMRDDASHSVAIPFDNFFTNPWGYVARQISKNEDQALVTTWQQDFTGECHVTFPLSSADLSKPEIISDFLSAYDTGSDFVNLLTSYNVQGGMLIDLSQLFAALCGIFHRYSSIRQRIGIRYPIYVKSRLYNMWRRVPFLDMSEYIEFVREHRLPFVQESVIYAPTGVTPESFQRIDRSSDNDLSEAAKDYTNAGVTLGLIAQATGIPFQRIIDAEDMISRLLDMSQRQQQN